MGRKAKEFSLDELDGIIRKNKESYSLTKIGTTKIFNKKGQIQIIESIDIDEHNKKYLEELKERLETYDEEGFNFLGFNEEGIHKNGTEYSDIMSDRRVDGARYNARGWIKTEYHETILSKNAFTGTTFDIDGYDRDGYNEQGINREGFDKDGFGLDGYSKQGFNREEIHKETGTIYDPEGYTREGYNEEGYNREGLNKNGKTREKIDEQEEQQRKNFLGLRHLAEGYAKGEISIEDYLKNHKISIEELIDFAKKQSMPQEIVTSLYRKKVEYNQYKTRFNKKEYFKNKTIINGAEITEEIVDKVLAYLKANDRYLSLKIVNEHIRAVANGELVLDDEEKQEEQPLITEKGARTLAKQVPMQKDDAKNKISSLEQPEEMQKDASEVSLSDE